MSDIMRAKLVIDAHDVIGEGPAWDRFGQRLLWLDNAVGLLHELKLGPEGAWQESKKRSLGRPTGAVIPRAQGGLIVFGGTEVFTANDAGHLTPFARIDADPEVVHLGDGKCDPQGRLWLGTQPNDFTPGRCALYRIDPDGAATTVLEHVGLSNGLEWSPDGKTLYYIDSFTRSVDAFDFDAHSGTIAGRRSIVKIGVGRGGFDGMTVDREGCLWVAVFGPGEVHRYSPAGDLLARVQISAPAATSCAFGGADGADLFITSASIVLPPAVVSLIGCSAETAEKSPTAPGAGGLFVCRPGATGEPATPFAG